MFHSSVQEQFALSVHHADDASYTGLLIEDIRRDYWIFSYVCQGAVEMKTGHRTYRVQPGSVMIHPTGIPFGETSDKPGLHLVLYVDQMAAPHIELFNLYPVAPVIALAEPKTFEAEFFRLLQVWQGDDTPTRSLYVFGKTLELFALVLDSWEKNGRETRPDSMATAKARLAIIVRYMELHLTDKITREMLAELIHLMPGYLDRIFYRTYGIAPMRLLRDMRLKKAQKLPESADQPLRVISAQCGFADSAYFHRVFRKTAGVSPGEYRKQMSRSKEGYI